MRAIEVFEIGALVTLGVLIVGSLLFNVYYISKAASDQGTLCIEQCGGSAIIQYGGGCNGVTQCLCVEPTKPSESP